MINIIDVVHKKYKSFGKDEVQVFYIVDKMPDFTYKKDRNYLYASDSGFHSSFREDRGSSDAFGGRKFTIKTDHGDIQASGQFWSYHYDKWNNDGSLFFDVAISTYEALYDCFVFRSVQAVDRDKIVLANAMIPKDYGELRKNIDDLKSNIKLFNKLFGHNLTYANLKLNTDKIDGGKNVMIDEFIMNNQWESFLKTKDYYAPMLNDLAKRKSDEIKELENAIGDAVRLLFPHSGIDELY